MAKSLSRLACRARTPMMKNAPRPTASRMTRVWLPGLATCKRPRIPERLDRSDEDEPGDVQNDCGTHEPAGEHQPHTKRAGLPRSDRDERTGHERRGGP